MILNKTLTRVQYDHLKHISNNSISLSAFSGMIFNSYVNTDEDRVEDRIIQAIDIKQTLLDMINKFEKENK